MAAESALGWMGKRGGGGVAQQRLPAICKPFVYHLRREPITSSGIDVVVYGDAFFSITVAGGVSRVAPGEGERSPVLSELDSGPND